MKFSDLNPFRKLKKKGGKMGDEKLEQRVQEVEESQAALAEKVGNLAATLSELKSYLDSKFEELGAGLVEHTNQPDEGEVEQRGFKRGQEGVVLGFENNALVGELEPIARRIFAAIRSQGYDIVPKEQLAEATGEAETEEGKDGETPEPPYLHIISSEERMKLPEDERKQYFDWPENKFAKIVEA